MGMHGFPHYAAQGKFMPMFEQIWVKDMRAQTQLKAYRRHLALGFGRNEPKHRRSATVAFRFSCRLLPSG